jgi:tetratricopeptide (TPR) repeat protein
MDPSHSGGAFHPHFSPWLADPEQLQRTLVAHHQTLQEFLARLRAVEDGAAANHLILVGPRGFGKTHLLSLTERYVSGRLPIPTGWTAPAQPWVCAFFTEEEYAGQDSLANFLLTLFSKLLESSPIEPAFRLPDQISGEEDQAVIECCFERLEMFYHDRRQRILLVIDNLQKVLQQWTESEHQRLRSFLSRNAFLVVLGSAPTVFEEVLDQKAAFHDFFELRLLPRLTSEQELELLEHRFAEDGRQSEFAARRADLERKIPAIEILTGGNPRLILFLYQITSQATFLDIEVALRRLLEELREYFVRRFDELPPQGRKVLDTMAQMSGPATPTEIAKAARLTQALVNMQLKRLKSGHYVRPVKFQRAKSTRYDITDSLFRIWRQTATVAGRQRFRFLADFLKLYFTPDEVRAMYAQHAQCLCSELPVPRAEITRRVDELYYFQAVGQPDVRYGAFSSRVESLLKIGEFRWAEQEVQFFAAESIKGHDEAGTRQAYRYQAEVHRQEGHTAEALQDIKRLIDIGDKEEAGRQTEKLSIAEPDSVNVWWAVGVTQGNLGHYLRSLEAFRKIAQLEGPTGDNWTNQAIALNELNEWEEARQCAKSALDMAPKSVLAWAQVGLAAGHLNDDEQALEAFSKAAEIGGATAELWRFQSTALNNLGRGAEALVAAESALAMEPNGIASRIQLGIAAAMLGQPERALQAFREAAELGGPTANLWTWQAILLNHLDRREEALHCAESAVSLDPDHVSAWQQLADAAGVLGRHEQALCAFRKVAGLAGQTASLWTNQVIALNQLGRGAEAIQCAKAALEIDPRRGKVWLFLGQALMNLGEDGQALDALRRAAEYMEPCVEVFLLQAFVLQRLGMWKEGLASAEAALALDVEHPMALHFVGFAAANLGQTDRACTALRKSVELGGPNADTLLLLAKCLHQAGRLKDALSAVDESLASQPDSAEAWLTKGWILGEERRFEEALQCAERARQNDATDRDYYHAIGDLNLLGGAFTDAQRQLESGLKSQPDDWDLQVDHTIASGCLGWHGPLMEALPPNLNRVNIPPQSTSAICEFMFKIAANCLRRGEIETARGLLNANLEMNSWHESDWYRKLLGGFLRYVIDISPSVFPAFVDLVSHKTLTEDTRSILDPFVKAKELLETRDLTILERLFPEVRELVLDVVRRVEPAFYDSLKRFA